MSPRPQTVTGLETESTLARIVLTWQPLGWDPLIDHYRVYAVRSTESTRGPHPRETDLLGKTVYPRFVHEGLDPTGEEWTYTIVAVSDAGDRSNPSRAFTSSSQVSVTATGHEVAAIGRFDGKSLEFQFAPNQYSQIPVEYPEALIEYTQKQDDPADAWPYLLPGPGDAWAGRRAYRALWNVTLDQAPATDYDLAVWLIDTTRLGGRLEVRVNDSPVTDIALPEGATRGSREGDATVPGSTLLRSYHEFAVPASALQAGTNTLAFHLAEGGWVAWDAVGLFARL